MVITTNMLRSSPSAGSSQYELLNTPQRESPEDHSDAYDSTSSVSRSTSPERRLSVGNYHDDAPTNTQIHSPAQVFPLTTRRLYVPTVLRRRSLVLLASLFVLLAACLLLLFVLSNRNGGISDLDDDLFYVWTYGPTAVFTIISIFWYGVEFRTMQLWSWHLIRRNPTFARDIVLNYTSMWDVWAMLLAIRRRHSRIVVVVLGTLLLNLLTVISTALFTNKSTTLGADISLRLATVVQPPSNLNLAPINALPYQQAFLVMHLNTTPPLGTNGALVYEQFFDDSKTPNITASFATNTSYTAQVKTLMMRMECENGTVIHDLRGNASDSTALTINSASCANTSLNTLPSVYSLQGGDYGIWASLGCCDCGINDAVLAPGVADGPQSDNGQDWRLFVTANHFKTHRTNLSFATLENSDFISYVCTAKVDGQLANITLARDSSTNQLISHLVLGQGIDAGLSNTSGAQLLLGAYKTYYSFTGGGISYNFLLNPGDDGDIPKFYDSAFLREKIEDSLPKLMAQVGSSYFMSAANNTVAEGRISTISNRLVLRNISFYLMITALLILCIICTFMGFAKPLESCSRDPSSLAGIAAILSQSPQLRSALRATGPYSIDDLKKAVGLVKVQSHIDIKGSYSIVCDQQADLFVNNKDLKWWRPLTSTIPFRVLVIAAPLGLITLLEACVQMSNKHGYLLAVSTEGGSHYLWLYTFPLLFLGVRSLFEMVNFNSKLFQPLHQLSKGNAPADTSLLGSLNGKIAIVALVKSLKHAHWSVAASSFAMLFGPFLSILVASLFIGVPASTSHEVKVRQVDRWNFSDPTGSLYYSPLWYPGIDGAGASLGITAYLGQNGVIPSMILDYNLSFPKWTTGQFVLPTFEVLNTTEQSANVTVQARLPAMRPVLNCEEANGRISVHQYNASFRGSGTIEVNITYGLSGLGTQNDNCGYGDNITIGVHDLLSFQTSMPPNFYYGQSMDTGLSILNLTTRNDCPTRVFFLSHLQSSTVKVLGCKPQIEQVEVDVTMNYPDLSFSVQHPPAIVPGTPLVVQNRFFNSSHAVPASDIPEGGSLSSVADPLHSSGRGDVFPSINEVENTLLGYGSNTFAQITSSFGTSLEDMFNDIELMDSQLEKLYGILVGQLLRSYGIQDQAPGGNDPNQGDIQATLTTYNEQIHLIDNTIISRVLEGILLLMTLCIIASMALQHTRKVVPKDPEGIIAVMSLIAGAGPRFWALFDKVEGVEWMSDDEMAARGVFDGVKFRMGWNGDASRDDRNGQYSRLSETEPSDDDRERRWCIDVDEGPDPGVT